MDPVDAAIIDFTETAYNLGLHGSEWLPQLLVEGNQFIGDGLGVAGISCWRGPEPGAFRIEQVHVESCPDDFVQSVMMTQVEVSPDLLWNMSRPTHPKTLSEAAEDGPGFQEVMQHFQGAEDGLGMSAFDPDGHGVYLIAPLRKRISLNVRERERLQMVASHFGAGSRLRRALNSTGCGAPRRTALPHEAEAVFDATTMRMTDAAGEAKNRASMEELRGAAKRIDRARGRLRRSDPIAALELWTSLVRGRWSMVDWFDSDSRRYVLAVPNSPTVGDPRGLTEREAQVVSYLIAGHTNKLIGYQLGLSKGRVSTLVGSSMRKLGVRTRGQLIKKWSVFAEAIET